MLKKQTKKSDEERKYEFVKRAAPVLSCACIDLNIASARRQESTGIDYESPLVSRVYVGRRSNVPSLVKRLRAALLTTKSASAVHRVGVHGMGAAIPVAVRVALALQQALCSRAASVLDVRVCTHTHTVVTLDDYEPLEPDLARVTKTRNISAICIQVQIAVSVESSDVLSAETSKQLEEEKHNSRQPKRRKTTTSTTANNYNNNKRKNGRGGKSGS